MTTSKLPPHVYAVKDRHGKMRYRFKRKGWKDGYLHGEPGSERFHREYADLLSIGPLSAKLISTPNKPTHRSLDDLIMRAKATLRWRRKKDRTRLVQSRILDRFSNRVDGRGRRYGERPVAAITVAWLDKAFVTMADTPAAANVLRKVLAGVMDHAVKLGWRPDNPVRFTDRFDDATEGHHMWTEEEIAQYRNKHALGTMARLTLEVALNTAARRCNVATLTRDDIVDGRIVTSHVKGNNEASVPILATTKAAIEALPAAPIRHLITTTYGKPFTVNGLGNRVRKWCNDAGLPHCSIHGLRKAMSRRIAESGGTDAEGQAVTGHKKAATFASYRAKANRTALADRAFTNLASRFDGQPENSEEDQ